MTWAMDELRALEERFNDWQERYREYCATLAKFRAYRQEFDSLMARWEQEHRRSSSNTSQETPPDGKVQQ